MHHCVAHSREGYYALRPGAHIADEPVATASPGLRQRYGGDGDLKPGRCCGPAECSLAISDSLAVPGRKGDGGQAQGATHGHRRALRALLFLPGHYSPLHQASARARARRACPRRSCGCGACASCAACCASTCKQSLCVVVSLCSPSYQVPRGEEDRQAHVPRHVPKGPENDDARSAALLVTLLCALTPCLFR